MNEKDDYSSEIDTLSTRFPVETNMADIDDLNYDVESYKFNNSSEWQSAKSPYECLIFGWGNTQDGELGLGGIEDQYILVPHKISFHDSENIKVVSCGEHHTLVVTYNGMVYSCGNNDFGQLGRENSRTKLQKVSNLNSHNIINVACGEYNSIAMTEWGQLFSWGSNSYGQLGAFWPAPQLHAVEKMAISFQFLSTKCSGDDLWSPWSFSPQKCSGDITLCGMSHNLIGIQPVPRIIKTLATKTIVQIACGYRHCLALSNDGTLYCWGSNEFGQLGIGANGDKVKVICLPTVVKALVGVPIAFIACGGYHSFAVSITGAVYSWGENSFGQLGLNHQIDKNVPCPLNSLRSVGVKYISCGEDFSVFLTVDGGVFSCGAGMYGQLGHGSLCNEILPRKVIELMGSIVTQVCCGRRHTLALIPTPGRVYAFGLGGVGQLGNRLATTSSTPQVVLGPWLSSNVETLQYNVRRIYAGGDHCVVTVSNQKHHVTSDDCRIWSKNNQILNIDIEKFMQCLTIPANIPIDQDLLQHIETVLSSYACINASFINTYSPCNYEYSNVNMNKVSEFFDLVSKIEHQSINDTVLSCISTVIANLPYFFIDAETLRAFTILPFYHEFLNPKNSDILQIPFGEIVLRIHSDIENWYKNLSEEHFERLVLNYKNVFIEKLKTVDKVVSADSWDSHLIVPLEILRILNQLNQKDRISLSCDKRSGYKVAYSTFYVSELSEAIDINIDYAKWCFENPKKEYYFCNYPFIFDAEAKNALLKSDQMIQMRSAIEQGLINAMFFTQPIFGNDIQFLEIHVSRDNIVADTLREITMHGSDLKKPLRVKFFDEEAEDVGGVKKEFFMLVMREILDPKYGMFQQYDETNSIWFKEDTFEEEGMFYMIGILCGLAIYNFIIINLPFPLAMYKKLLNEPVGLQDLRDLSPTLHKSLEDVLNYNDSDLEEVFGLNFDITRELYGEIKVIPLKPNGQNIPVTKENRHEFVELYVDMILNKLVETSFNSFNDGFHKVCGSRVLQLFHAQELMSVIIGNEDYDWYQLENEAIYKKGYSSSDPTILLFWEVFHELPIEDKKKFLLFLTGSDRIPIQGMKAIKVVIQPTADDKYLPVAHTCFNLLDLPRYNTKEKLRYKLLQAIQQTEGFSLV